MHMWSACQVLVDRLYAYVQFQFVLIFATYQYAPLRDVRVHAVGFECRWTLVARHAIKHDLQEDKVRSTATPRCINQLILCCMHDICQVILSVSSHRPGVSG